MSSPTAMRPRPSSINIELNWDFFPSLLNYSLIEFNKTHISILQSCAGIIVLFQDVHFHVSAVSTSGLLRSHCPEALDQAQPGQQVLLEPCGSSPMCSEKQARYNHEESGEIWQRSCHIPRCHSRCAVQAAGQGAGCEIDVGRTTGAYPSAAGVPVAEAQGRVWRWACCVSRWCTRMRYCGTYSKIHKSIWFKWIRHYTSWSSVSCFFFPIYRCLSIRCTLHYCSLTWTIK